ncbi:MAG: YicC family protein [Bacteroidales bacterium]|nr:YicC family protein [Bacteroidales bacterium]
MQVSMTGFCHLSEVLEDKIVHIDIKSLNSKSFDFNVRLPYIYKELEQAIRNIFSKELVRGKIDVTINIEWINMPATAVINKALFKNYYESLWEIKKELSITDYEPDWFAIIVRMPDVIQNTSVQINEKEKNTIIQLLELGAQKVKEFRQQEGKNLINDILERLNIIEQSLEKIKPYEHERLENLKNRIIASFNELHFNQNVDWNRFEQELVYYIEKLDITEEKVRVRSHCKYFKEVAANEPLAGKKLMFIAQELTREINTLGAKAQDFNIQQIVVMMKDELEKIKEQLMNIL